MALSLAQQQRAVPAPFRRSAAVRTQRSSSKAPWPTCSAQKPVPQLSQLVLASQQPLMPPR